MDEILEIACQAYMKSSDPGMNWRKIPKKARQLRKAHMRAAFDAVASHELEPVWRNTYIENGRLKLKRRTDYA